ncbi:MAG TPA: F0F1 ATP synthase subunit B [Candidatus Dormibacteraeota bacterium]|jgi:F-type H+-transporting ATPase subunit b|nr:F0F1 ATP synthase subunit B [Candidatus Dormibacteraeota bacterium]
MQAFFDSFGVNYISLIWYLVLFGLVLWLLSRYAFKPILRTIEERQRSINQALDEAEDAAKSISQSQDKAEKILWDASAEAQEIIRRAEKVGEDIQDRAREVARAETDAQLAKAKVEIDRERLAAIQDIRRTAVDLALFAAGHVIEKNLDSADNMKLAEEAIQQAELRA